MSTAGTSPEHAAPVSGASPETDSPGFPTRKQLFGILLGYFALQVVVRTFLSSSVDLDESEQVLFAQKLSWGYGPEPPLYTWLQIPVFALFGLSVFSLALLKDLLLFCTYFFTYTNARLITRSHACGVVAAVSLFFIPQIAWESQRDLTHTVLASTLAAATLLCFLRVLQSKRTLWFVLLGLCVGLGLLSKFNFGLWVFGLLLASLSMPQLRPSVLDRRMLLALLICLVVLLPNALWILDHRDLAFGKATKFAISREPIGWLTTICIAFRNVFVGLASFLGPLALVYLLVFWKAPKRPASLSNSEYPKMILRALLIIFSLLLLLVLCFKATGFRERWFQPILICAPVLAVSAIVQRLSRSRLKTLLTLSFGIMLLVAAAIPSRILFGEALKREEPLMRPYRELATQIRPLIPDSALIVADTSLLGGNLRLAFPDKPVFTPNMDRQFQVPTQHCFLVWDARKQDLPPQKLRNWAETFAPGSFNRGHPQYFTATYHYHHQKQMRLGVLAIR